MNTKAEWSHGTQLVAVSVDVWDGTTYHVTEYYTGHVDTSRKSFRGRGAQTRAAKYAQATGAELVDLAMIHALASEVFHAHCK